MSSNSKSQFNMAETLFRWKLAEAKKHIRGLGEVWVTDLVTCGYKIFLEEKFPEVKESEPLNPVTLEGDLVHKGVQRIIKECFSGYASIEEEVEGVKEVGGVKIKGRLDLLLVYPWGERHGVEIKHVQATYNAPYDHHLLQCKIYRWLFNLDSIELLYVSRDRITSIPVEGLVSEEDVVKLVLSPRYATEEWMCRYCPYSFVCDRRIMGRGERS